MKNQLLNFFSPKKLFLFGVVVLFSIKNNAQVTTFNYTGALQTYTVPAGVTSIRIETWGAQGQGGNGGNGGYCRGDASVTPGQILYVYVGGQAGYNGGGVGHASVPRNGGGGSDVRVSPYGLNDRIIVAGGGGAGGPTDVGIRNGGAGGGGTIGVNYTGGDGGNGYGGNGLPGGVNGGAGNTSCHSGGGGGGGLNSGGGAACNTCYTSTCGLPGTLGQGGNGDTWENGICYSTYGGTNGGGGGYYGGGGSSVGNCGGGGGGGGSTYVGTLANTSMTGGIRTGDGQIVITVLNGITVTQSAQILCNGQSTATLTATPFGGQSPYTYFWSPTGGTSATASGLAAGTYTVTVHDANNVVTTQTFTVTQPTIISITSSHANVACNGNNNGSATVNVSGGTPGYTYSWSPTGGTSATALGLIAGSYTCTVTDANGCTSTSSVTITQPSTALAVTSTHIDILCNGSNAGSATVSTSGGTPGYTYSWSPSGGTASTANGLIAGSYTCTVTDANGCTSTASATITQPTAMAVTSTQINVLCNGNNTGSATVSASGGTPSYTYSWSPSGGTTATASGLIAGSYTCTVTDANGCVSTKSVTITQPAVLSGIIVTSTNPTTCGGTNGLIDVSVSGGTSPYTYLWSNSMTSQDLSNLPAGSYTNTITDANSCTTTASVTLSNPALPIVSAVLDTTLCVSSGIYNIPQGSPTGGTWSGTTVSANTFNPNAAGIGSYVLTYMYTDVNNCSASASDTILVDACLGFNGLPIGNNFTVSPNPSNGNFVIEINTTQDADVLIYNSAGQLVSSKKVPAQSKQQMNIPTSGVYNLVVVTADGKRSTQRVVINK